MPAALTDEDKSFLRGILDRPDDLTTWLVYADWLDDRSDPRAEFLRLTVERWSTTPRRVARIDARLATLRATLDPVWMSVFETGRVSNCRPGGPEFACPMTWDGLAPTDEPGVRTCHACRDPVYFCHTPGEARQVAAAGRRFALSARAAKKWWKFW